MEVYIVYHHDYSDNTISHIKVFSTSEAAYKVAASNVIDRMDDNFDLCIEDDKEIYDLCAHEYESNDFFQVVRTYNNYISGHDEPYYIKVIERTLDGISSEKVEGSQCTKCGIFSHMSVPNQSDGTFKCWSCRNP